MNDGLDLGLTEDQLLALVNLIIGACGGGGESNDDEVVILGNYQWTHSCSEECSPAPAALKSSGGESGCSSVSSVGDFCEVQGVYICMKVSSTLVGILSGI